MSTLLSLRALNTLRSLQLSAANRHADAIETQHEHGCVDAITYDLLTEEPAGTLERVRAELLFKPGILFFVLCLFLVACGSDAPAADNPCACEHDPAVAYTVEHCTPQDDGTCTDAGVHEGRDLSALFEALCPTKPQQSCTGDVYTVVCEGRTSSFRLTPADTDDAGVAECTLAAVDGGQS